MNGQHSTDAIMEAALAADADKLSVLGADPGPTLLELETADGAFVKPATFWMVWTKGGRVPAYVHGRELTAQREAIRLAKKHPGQKFIVLAATLKFWVSEPEPEALAQAGLAS